MTKKQQRVAKVKYYYQQRSTTRQISHKANFNIICLFKKTTFYKTASRLGDSLNEDKKNQADKYCKKLQQNYNN